MTTRRGPPAPFSCSATRADDTGPRRTASPKEEGTDPDSPGKHEEEAREIIDSKLADIGWVIQTRDEMDLTPAAATMSLIRR